MKKTKIETYKNVDIFYNKNYGNLYFDFEGVEKEVKYLFEAHKIIDEPNWEVCELEGYFIEVTFNDYIGLAKARKKDKKSGKPYWKLKGKYDLDYKEPSNWRESNVYTRNNYRDKVYKEWKTQEEVVRKEETKRDNIIEKLKSNQKEGLTRL